MFKIGKNEKKIGLILDSTNNSNNNNLLYN